MNASIQSLPQFPGVWRGVNPRATTPTHSTRMSDLDRALLGGWPIGGLTQIVGSDQGLGFSLIIPALADLTSTGRFVALIQPPLLPYAPALSSRGIDLKKVLLIEPGNPDRALWAMEQCSRSGLFSAVAYWGRPLDSVAERRLQLAADAGRCLAFCFRASRREDHTYASVRLAVRPANDGNIAIDVLKCRGTQPGRRILQPCSGFGLRGRAA